MSLISEELLVLSEFVNFFALIAILFRSIRSPFVRAELELVNRRLALLRSNKAAQVPPSSAASNRRPRALILLHSNMLTLIPWYGSNRVQHGSTQQRPAWRPLFEPGREAPRVSCPSVHQRRRLGLHWQAREHRSASEAQDVTGARSHVLGRSLLTSGPAPRSRRHSWAGPASCLSGLH